MLAVVTICLTSNCSKTLNCEVLPGRIRCLGSIAIELAYIGKAISVTNKRLGALLKHINPQ